MPKDPTTIICPECATEWVCHCTANPCLFAGALCDDCQLRHLDAEPDPEVPAVQCTQ